MILYRGDNLKRIKPQDWFWTNGILINSANGGSPNTVSAKPILTLIEKHVYPEQDSFNYHNVSDFFSFSDNKMTAIKYMSGGKSNTKVSIHESPDHVLFSWEIINPREVKKGVYLYEYEINYGNSKKILATYSNIAAFIKYALSIRNEENTNSRKRPKVLLLNLRELIDYVSFDEVTVRRIKNDNEWLILPYDSNKYNPQLGLETYIYPNLQFHYDFYVVKD